VRNQVEPVVKAMISSGLWNKEGHVKPFCRRSDFGSGFSVIGADSHAVDPGFEGTEIAHQNSDQRRPPSLVGGAGPSA
jgi:hypothetical protein